MSPGHGRVEVTLLPVSKTIYVSVIPQADVRTYLNFMESYNYGQLEKKQKAEALVGKGVQIINQQPMVSHFGDPLVQQKKPELRKNMKHIANIVYERISDKQVISLPNPFGTTPVDAVQKISEPIVTSESEETSVEEP